MSIICVQDNAWGIIEIETCPWASMRTTAYDDECSRNITQWAYHKFSRCPDPKTKRKNNGVVCHATRFWKAKRMQAGRKGERERRRQGDSTLPLFRFASAFLVFCLSSKKKLLYGGKARVLPRRRKAERDPRLPPHHPGALGGPCRLTMRQSDGASQETRYHLPVKPKITWNPRRGVRCVVVCVKGDSPGGVGCCMPVLSEEHMRSNVYSYLIL